MRKSPVPLTHSGEFVGKIPRPTLSQRGVRSREGAFSEWRLRRAEKMVEQIFVDAFLIMTRKFVEKNNIFSQMENPPSRSLTAGSSFAGGRIFFDGGFAARK